MKDILLKKKSEFELQLQTLQKEIAKLQEQFVMTQGAYQYNQHLLEELEKSN